MAQNSDAVKQAMFEELQKILNPDSEQRKSAEARLAQLKFTEWYGVNLAEFTIDQQIHIGLRQLASVMLKQYVDDCWIDGGDDVGEDLAGLGNVPPSSSGAVLLVNDDAKRRIKQILPEGLYDQNSKIRSVVAYCIANIALYDWPGDWQELFDVIVKCLSGTENSIDGAMKVLVEFTLELDKQIADVAPLILSEVYRIFTADTVYNVTARKYAVEILYALLRAINNQIETRQQKSAILDPVLPNFMQRLIEGLTAPNGAHSSFQLKTQIIKVLKYMMSDMSKFVQPYLGTILPTIWQLLTQLADFYVKVVVNEIETAPFNGTEQDDDEVDDFVQMILQIFEFVHTIIEMKKYKAAITNVLTDLVYITVLYMQITEEQAQSWLEDPEKFVDDEDEQGVEFTIRTTAHDVLLIVGQEYEKQLLPCFTEALGKHSAVADVDRNAGNPYWWKIHESSLLAVGSFKDLIVENPNGFDMGQYLALIKMLMESQASPYLLGRCLWLLSRFCECDILRQPFMEQIVNVTIDSLALDKPVTLRIMAARAIFGFCTNLKANTDERHVLIMSKLEHFFDGLVPLFQQSQNTVLVLLLEAMSAIISFDVNVTATICPKVIDLTMSIFQKYHDDRFLLEMVQDVLKILSQNPFCLLPLQDRIIPTLVAILNSDQGTAEQTLLAPDIALDVLQTLVKYSQAPLSEAMIESAFPSAVHCILRSEDHSVMQAGGECLRSFLAVSPEQICRYKNGEGLNYVLQVATMLLNPMNTESTASFIGRLVITIITKVGSLLGDSVDLLLKAVISKMQLVESLNVIMSLVTIFAHLILLQLDAVMNFLSTVPGPTGETAMCFVLANWLSRQHLFYGQYERKVTTLALCKLFEHGVTTKDDRLNTVMIKEQQQMPAVGANPNAPGRRTRSATAKTPTVWVDTPVLVKIFKLLLHELANLREAKDARTKNLEDSGDEGNSTSDDETDDTSVDGAKISSFAALLHLDEGDDEEEDEDERQLMAELMNDPIFQCDTTEYLTKFIEGFSQHENFRAFLEKIDETEKKILQSFNISLM
ncbi:AGAP011156-PA-like protein [Anopheles sinensis]|uniref:AGAP011156-PA-like protein n=1 Tax=Anopheles sinensis TaxID=74873 RepID=A0A084VHT4_ANOSI|nr:AGAP011156-PA-like protein [Anopheles sinensis]